MIKIADIDIYKTIYMEKGCLKISRRILWRSSGNIEITMGRRSGNITL